MFWIIFAVTQAVIGTVGYLVSDENSDASYYVS